MLADNPLNGGAAEIAEHAVVVVGAGPSGLLLAGELALAGADVAIVERRSNQDLSGARALGLHAGTIELLEQRGIADRFLSAGYPAQVAGFAGTRFDISTFPIRHPYGLALVQKHIERLLAEWVDELAVPIYRGREVTGVDHHDTCVDVLLSNGDLLRADYLVGCDGGRSLIRKAAGIDFPGFDATTSNLIAEVETAQEPQWGMRQDDLGVHSFSRPEADGAVRVMVTEREIGGPDEPTLRDLSQALIAVYGTDYGIHSPRWISRFTDTARQASSYRNGRILLAGDAAHVHYPVGGQGLNTGAQDAVNLGWKLAQVVRGTSPESLLDTYHAERHPVGARVLRNTMAQVALRRPDDHTKAICDVISELLGMDEPRTRFAAMMSDLNIHYDLGNGHPLLGRRMPDVDLVTDDLVVDEGPARVSTLLHQARPVFLDFGSGAGVGPWTDRVRVVRAKPVAALDLPALGRVSAPAAVLIRPDGYVAWAGEAPHDGLADALTTWFGLPTSDHADVF